MKLKLAELLAERDISQADLAAALDVRRSAVNNWIRGANYPDFGSLEQLCAFFDVEPGDLLVREPDDTTKTGKTARSFPQRAAA